MSECVDPRTVLEFAFVGYEESIEMATVYRCPSLWWIMRLCTPLLATFFAEVCVGLTTPHYKNWARSHGLKVDWTSHVSLNVQIAARRAFGTVPEGDR